VTRASVEVESVEVGQIARGLCVLVGVGVADAEADAVWLADKVVSARIFTDEQDKMNLSVLDCGGSVLAISQFTLYGDMRRGTRPSFTQAMEPTRAAELFEAFCAHCRQRGAPVQTGRFRAHMEVSLNNTGPVTVLIDSKKQF
jgi:D-tyrosyl-tRNA(Tyr) deacylase